MPEVNVDINGRKYRLACEDGQEENLERLARKFDERVESFKGAFGEIGDNRLTIMAGLAVVDAMEETEKRISALEDELAALKEAGATMAAESEKFEMQVAERIIEAATMIEEVAGTMDAVGQDPT